MAAFARNSTPQICTPVPFSQIATKPNPRWSPERHGDKLAVDLPDCE